MAEPRKGKEYVQIDLRKAGSPPIVFMLDEDEEPACVVMQIFSGSVHVEIKADERALEMVYQAILQKRIELAKHLAAERGAARAMRRRK